MAANNLRVIYQNLADLSTTTITASTTAGGTTAGNLQKDAKALIWRSTGSGATLTIAFGSAKTIRGVILPFTNLTSTGTINVTCTGGSTTSTGNILAAPYAQTDSWDSSYLPAGANSYAYGAGTYARAWFSSAQTCTGLTITLTDTNLTYVEASRLIIGDYWSPTFNTSFGLVSAPKSLSTNSRTESGDLVTNRGIQYNSMSFDLAWLNPADRKVFTKILKSNGINKGIFISLFPNNGTATLDTKIDYDMEQTFQIYGKLSSLSDITHSMYTMYTAKVDIEEI